MDSLTGSWCVSRLLAVFPISKSDNYVPTSAALTAAGSAAGDAEVAPAAELGHFTFE